MECSVCFELARGSNVEKVVSTTCGHIFHEKCIKDWFKSVNSKICPQCRKDISERKLIKLYFNTEPTESKEEKRRRMELLVQEMVEVKYAIYGSKLTELESRLTKLTEAHQDLSKRKRKLEEELVHKNEKIASLETRCRVMQSLRNSPKKKKPKAAE